MKKIVFIVLILSIALILWYFMGGVPGENGPGGRYGQAVAIEAGSIQRMDISNVKVFTGSLQARSRFVVAPKVPGRLEKLYVNMGDIVNRGQLIAKLDSQEYEQNVEQARAELMVAEANVAESESALDVAKRELERITVLREKKIASESELDESYANYRARDAKHRVTMAQVRQREAALRAAQVRLSFTQIRASWENGGEKRVIGEKYVDEGAMLRANDPIVSVLDIDYLTALINITEKDYSSVRIGQPVILTSDAYGKMKYEGRVIRMAPALRENSRTADVEIEVANPGHDLKPGMFIRAAIELEKHDNALVVPFPALTARDDKQGVFLIDREEMKVSFVAVETGIVTSEWAEIIKPSIDGYVVTLGNHLLDDGSNVILQNGPSETDMGKDQR